MGLNPRPGGAAAPVAAGASFWRRALAVAALGLVGVTGLLLQPLPPGLAAQIPAAAGWPPLALKALLALNPALLVLGAALAGAALAHRTGLRSIAAGTAAAPGAGPVLARAAALGVALGLALAAADALLLPWMGAPWQRLVAATPADTARLGTGLLYGGLTEEVLLRWGLMSLLSWALAPLLRRYGDAAMAVAIALAAGVFAAAHLPVLAAQLDLTAPVVARTLLLNGAAGVVYGLLFWRHHLEAAMAAHAATHLGLWAWQRLAG